MRDEGEGRDGGREEEEGKGGGREGRDREMNRWREGGKDEGQTTDSKLPPNTMLPFCHVFLTHLTQVLY